MSDSPLFTKFRLSALAFAAIAGGAGALVLTSAGTAGDGVCNGKPADVMLEGTTTYRGDESNEVIVGDGGEQEVHGHSGNDTICGGGGDDSLAGGEENDKIFGQGDDDELYGRPGKDDLDGGPDSSDNKGKGKFGDECAGGKPNPKDVSTDPDIATDCEFERGVRQNPEQET